MKLLDRVAAHFGYVSKSMIMEELQKAAHDYWVLKSKAQATQREVSQAVEARRGNEAPYFPSDPNHAFSPERVAEIRKSMKMGVEGGWEEEGKDSIKAQLKQFNGFDDPLLDDPGFQLKVYTRKPKSATKP